MAISVALRNYAQWFNATSGYWNITKARAVRAEAVDDIVKYHEVLHRDFIETRRAWNRDSQAVFAEAVSPGSNPAWARELKTLFNMLGSAWVEQNDEVLLTDVGWAILNSAAPIALLERQVRKYQIGNPQTSGRLTSDIEVIPHFVILEFLLGSYPAPISKEEFIIFVSRVHSHQEIEPMQRRLAEFRRLPDADMEEFKSLLDASLFEKIARDFSYAANFLTLPAYLNYRKGRNSGIEVTNEKAARQALSWYRQGNDTYIAFDTLKDWYSYYGVVDNTASPIAAADYYRSVGKTERAVFAYQKAIEKGLAPLEDTVDDYRCRVNGEAALETWLVGNLGRLETGLSLVGSQYQTNEAGRIDILAIDTNEQYVVIELKRDKASDVAMGQLLRYMGWVRMHLAQGESARGFVVGDSIDDRMVYAILAHDELDKICELKRYSDLGVELRTHRSQDDCRAEVVELSTQQPS